MESVTEAEDKQLRTIDAPDFKDNLRVWKRQRHPYRCFVANLEIKADIWGCLPASHTRRRLYHLSSPADSDTGHGHRHSAESAPSDTRGCADTRGWTRGKFT